MNIKEYISSGIVESYVLGLASAEERAEFEQLCRQYPELIAARNSFELKLETQAFESAVEPPAAGRQQFIDFIKQDNSINQSKVVSMENTAQSSPRKSFKWLAAASVIFCIVAGYYAYTLYNENKTLKSELVRSVDALSKLDARIEKLEGDQEKMMNKDAVVVNLVGTTPAKARADIYWDSTSTNVFLVVKNMPQLTNDKQYQLWALLDGKPTDLGLFDAQGENKVILKMKNVQKADAFAITIENKGNTGGPNLEQLQSMGKPSL